MKSEKTFSPLSEAVNPRETLPKDAHTANSWNAVLQSWEPGQRLQWAAEHYGAQAALSSSLGLEDQLLTHEIFEGRLPIRVFTIDTGRLFEESLDVFESTRRRYGRAPELFFPPANEVESLVAAQGVLGFYESVPNRLECCRVRKVLPLERALRGVKVWITGLRREQDVQRADLPILQWDETRQLLKLNPLADRDWQWIKGAADTAGVPVNRLHAKGYPSIGCAPCTRALSADEDPRAGRWWWEQDSRKECGLHLKNTKQREGDR